MSGLHPLSQEQVDMAREWARLDALVAEDKITVEEMYKQLDARRNRAKDYILNLHFPIKDEGDTRHLFLTPIQATDAWQAVQAPGDASVIRRFSHYETPDDI